MLAARDETRLVQQLELLGDIGLTGIEPLDNGRNAEFARFQLLQNRQPGRFRKSAKQGGHAFELVRAKFH